MKIRTKRGQLAFYASALISLIVLILGLFAYEVSEYCLAREQLQTAVEASALACETTLASSGIASSQNSQNNAFGAAAHVFQLNSILGKSLVGATLANAGDPPPTAAGEAAISFQLLDPITHEPASNLQPGANAGAVIQATGTFAYMPSFSRFVGTAFQPIRLEASVLSGVRPLDLVVAMDISGGMDDETPVTLVHRYWDYDNNFPPHHIVYMVPDAHGDPNQPAQGYLGDLFCYQAPHVNGLWPQGLDNGVLPTLPNCQQKFSELPNTATCKLRCAGNSDAGNPPGNYVAAFAGDNAPPATAAGSGTGQGPVSGSVNNDINAIAACVQAVDNASVGTTGFGWGGPIPDTVGGFVPPDPRNQPMINLTQAIYQGELDGISGQQIIEAFNAGNAAAAPVASMYIQMTSMTGASMECLVPAGPPFVQNSISGFPSSYTRYNMEFASGSAASDPNEVLSPTGTQGPSVGTTPTVMWGPSYSNTFTDMVVNLDGNTTFNSYTNGAYTFPCVGALVEASRGDLENSNAATGCGLDLGALGGVTPLAGYQAAYQQAALLQIQPLRSIVSTLPNFLTLTTQVGDTNLGFSTFNDTAGTKPNDTFKDSNVAPVYPAGGKSDFPLPGIQLGANNINAITSALPGLRVGGNRNVAKAIETARKQLTKKGRQGSQKAILLITDGAPEENLNGTLDQTTALADARAQAALAKQDNIAIFCIAVTADATTQSAEEAIYNDTNNSTSSGGLSAIAGNGGRFYQVQYSGASGAQTNLTTAFGNVVRQLCSLIRK
jgi:hypothetical protein